ncbi:MAG: hypothetical protein H6592_04000 [Flavobacteriales bacterium]|nr:hypothetical protein [Flavobacteriales bacterium]
MLVELTITISGLMILIHEGNAIHAKSKGSLQHIVGIDEYERGLRARMEVYVKSGNAIEWEALLLEVVSLETARRRFRKALANARSLRIESIRILVLSFAAAFMIAGCMVLGPAMIDSLKKADDITRPGVVVNAPVTCNHEKDSIVVQCPSCPDSPSIEVDLSAVVIALEGIKGELDGCCQPDTALHSDAALQMRITDLEKALDRTTHELNTQNAHVAQWYIALADRNLFRRCKSRKKLNTAVSGLLQEDLKRRIKSEDLPRTQ